MTAVFLGVLFAFIGFGWWAGWLGKRTGIYFFLPYASFMVGVILFILGLLYLGRDTPNYSDGMDIFFYVLIGIEFLAFLLEFFLFQPKCSGCKRRLGMKRVSTSDFDRYDYIGTKDHKVVSKTELQFTAHYLCKYCGAPTSQGEIETYVNE